MFKMIIGSDIVPTETNFDLFEKADIETLAGKELLDILNEADFRAFNLETPICDNEEPIPKYGPCLMVPLRAVPGIKAFNPDMLLLANNHILDQGQQGLNSTLKVLDEWKIPYMGAGKNLAEAGKPRIIEADGKKIGFYNAAEHEFTIATEEKGGAFPFDFLNGPDEIAKLKEECDYVIVFYHAGKEHYRYPSPNLKKVCRKMVDKGADFVICQHTHCVGCMEEYNGATIVYGQGNFLFDHSEREEWQTSILARLQIDDEIRVDYIPICKDGNKVRLANEDEAKEIMDGFYSRTEEIKIPGVIEEKYKECCKVFEKWYLYCMAGGEARTGGTSADFSTEYPVGSLLAMINYFTCEPHLETLTTIAYELAREKLGDRI